MRDIVVRIVTLVVGLALLAGAVIAIGNMNQSYNATSIHETLATLDSEANSMNDAGLSVNVQDPNKGGLFTVARAQANADLKDTIKFEDDTSLTLKITDKDKLALSDTTVSATLGTDGPAFTGGELDLKGCLQGNKSIPKIVPDVDEVKTQLLLGLCSVKGTSLEKDVIDNKAILGAKDRDELLKKIFDGTADANGGYKGCVGLQMISPSVIDKSLKGGKGKLKNYTAYVVCEVKSEAKMLEELGGTGADKDKAMPLIQGLRNLQEGQVVLIPKKGKAIVKDSDGVGIFTSNGRLKR